MYKPPGNPQNEAGYMPSPQGEGSSVLGMIGSFALTMGAFEIGRRVASPWLRGVNVALGAVAGRYLRGASAAASATSRGLPALQGSIGGGVVNKIFKGFTGAGSITGGGGYASLSGMLMATRVVAKTANVLRVGQYMGAYSAYQTAIATRQGVGAIGKARTTLQNASAFMSGSIGGKRIAGAGSFKDRFMGRTLLDLKRAYLPTLPAFYAADKALGILPGQHNTKPPDWWNPLSVGADFAKFAGGFYPIHLMFGGVGKAISLGGAKVKTSIHDNFTVGGKQRNFLETLLRGHSAMQKSAARINQSQTVGNFKRYYRASMAGLRSFHASDATIATAAFAGNRGMAFKGAFKQAHKAFIRVKNAPVKQDPLAFLQGTQLHALMPALRGSQSMSNIVEDRAREKAQFNAFRLIMIGHQKGVNRTNRESFWAQVITGGRDKYKSRLGRTKARLIAKELGVREDTNVHKLVVDRLARTATGQSTFRIPGGGILDLSKANLAGVIDKTLKAMDKFQFMGGRIKPFDFFKISHFLAPARGRSNAQIYLPGDNASMNLGRISNTTDELLGTASNLHPMWRPDPSRGFAAGMIIPNGRGRGKAYTVTTTGAIKPVNHDIDFYVSSGAQSVTLADQNRRTYKVMLGQYTQTHIPDRASNRGNALSRLWNKLDTPFGHDSIPGAVVRAMGGMASRWNANSLFGPDGNVFVREVAEAVRAGKLNKEQSISHLVDLRAMNKRLEQDSVRTFQWMINQKPEQVRQVIEKNAAFANLGDVVNDHNVILKYFRKVIAEAPNAEALPNAVTKAMNLVDHSGPGILNSVGIAVPDAVLTNHQILLKHMFDTSVRNTYSNTTGISALNKIHNQFLVRASNPEKKQLELELYNVYAKFSDIAKGIPTRPKLQSIFSHSATEHPYEVKRPIIDADIFLQREDTKRTLNAWAQKHHSYGINPFRAGWRTIQEARYTHPIIKGMENWVNASAKTAKDLSQIDGAFSHSGVYNHVAAYAAETAAVSREQQTFVGNARLMMIDRLNRTADWFGGGVEADKYATASDMFKAIILKRIALGGAMTAAWMTADQLTAATPFLDPTFLKDGLNVAIADQLVKHRMTVGHVFNAMGVTSLAQWQEGLAPGSPGLGDSPLASMVRGLGIPFMGMGMGAAQGHPLRGLAVGTAASALIGFGTFNLTKDPERLAAEFAGQREVPIRKGRWWELGRTPFRGSKIEYYRPNWYARMKSQYQYTDTLYGSHTERILYAPMPILGMNPLSLPAQWVDPYHYERKHYLSRPYPETGGLEWGTGMPVVGNLLSSVFTPIMKPKRSMHDAEMEMFKDMATTLHGAEGPGLGGLGHSYSSTLGTVTRADEYRKLRQANSLHGAKWNLGETLYRTEEAAGLIGFGAQTLTDKAFSEQQPFGSEAYLDNASKITSTRRMYWDMNLGGLGGTTEFLRRLIPRERSEARMVNPIRNRMPGWLPGGSESEYYVNFRTGDPYTKVKEGEIRLPGQAYESLHGVSFTFPARSSWLGRGPKGIADIMLGAIPDPEEWEEGEPGTLMRRGVQNALKRSNMLVEANAKLFDPMHRLSGTVDAVVREGRQKKIVEIKLLSTETLEKLAKPIPAHISQINSLMSIANIHKGVILYVSSDNANVSREFDVFYNSHLFEKDMRDLLFARKLSAMGKRNDDGDSFEGYSMLDRLRVLADVAPYSDEYKETLKRLQLMQRHGMLGQDDKNQIEKIKDQRAAVARRYDFYPYRFKWSGIVAPDSQYTLMSANEHIRAASEYSAPERVLGAIWEAFCLSSDQLILTSSGPKMAKSVKIGDTFIDENGSFVPVKNISTRSVSENIKRIKLWTMCDTLSLTANHEIYVVRQQTQEYSHRKHIDEKALPLFIPAHEVQSGDYLVIPKITSNTVISDDLCRLVGYYLAEGSIKKDSRNAQKHRGVIFAFHEKEHEYIKDVVNLLQNNWRQPKIHNHPASHCTTVELYDSKCAEWFTQFGIGAKHKHLGILKFSTGNAAANLLKGYMRGDGYYHSKQSRSTSISRELTSDLLMISYNLNMTPSMYSYKQDDTRQRQYSLHFGGQNNKCLSEITEDFQYQEPHRDCNGGFTFIRENYILLRVRHIEDVSYTGLVYDFETNGSYVTCAGIVHNSHMESPLHNKLLSYRTPREHYERTRLYGRESAFWDHPVRDFAEPWATSLMSTRGPIEGAWRGALAGGMAFGFGSPLMPATAAVVSAFGSAQGAIRNATDSTWIPSKIRARRDLNIYFDKLEYMKARRLYELTGEEEYAQAMSETFTGLGGMGWKSNVNAYRSLGYDEKPYFWTFLEETDPDEQHKISQRVSPQLSYMLQQLWGEKRLASQPGLAKDRETSERITDYFSSHNLPDENWRGWDSSVNFDDIKVKTIRKEGLDEHDFGLGWYDQEYRMRNSQGTPGGLDYNMSTGNQPFPESDISYSQVNKIIRAGLRKLGLHAQSVQINIVPGNGGGTINLTIEAPGTTLSETINPMKVSI